MFDNYGGWDIIAAQFKPKVQQQAAKSEKGHNRGAVAMYCHNSGLF